MNFITYPFCSDTRYLDDNKLSYSDMATLSVASLRATNPEIDVQLVTDRQTVPLLPTRLLDQYDRVISIESPNGNIRERSRFVKIHAAIISKKPFLLLDVDTLVRSPLTDVFLTTSDLAAVEDKSQVGTDRKLDPSHLEMITKGMLTLRRSVYINSGVVYFNDSATTQKLSERWYDLWMSASRLSGLYFDQPCLNAALSDPSISLTLLPDGFNLQNYHDRQSSENAQIWHYFGSLQRSADIITFGLELVRLGLISEAVELLRMCSSPHLGNGRSQMFARHLYLAGYRTRIVREIIVLGLKDYLRPALKRLMNI